MRNRSTIEAARATLVAIFVCATLVAAGQEPRQATLDTAFELRGGQTATIRGEQLEVRFDRVVADSRCPRGAQCVRAGDVRIALTLQKTGHAAEAVELTLPSRPPAGAAYAGYQIDLQSVTPSPEVGRETRAEDYVATLTVRRT